MTEDRRPVRGRGRLRALLGRLALAGMLLVGAAVSAATGASGRPGIALAEYDGPAIYAIDAKGNLYCYHHTGWLTGDFTWQNGNVVGIGWNGFTHVFAGSGAIYAITPDGTLLWYKHDGENTCEGLNTPGAWEGPKVVGTGWDAFKEVFAGSGGIIYAINWAGQLLEYKHLGYQTGDFTWQGPTVVSDEQFAASDGTLHTGGLVWADYKQVFAGDDGAIYAIDKAGDLLWYKNFGWSDGYDEWSGPIFVSQGWGNYAQVFAAPDGVIYAITRTTSLTAGGATRVGGRIVRGGQLLWFKDLAYDGYAEEGLPDNWQGPKVVGQGWQSFTSVFQAASWGS